MKTLLAATLVASAVLVSTALAAAPKPKIVGNVKLGKSIFRSQGCGSCHMMAAANEMDGSGLGPDLDSVHKTYAQIVKQITNGGGGMTPYKKVLTTAQIQDLAAFIYTTSQKS